MEREEGQEEERRLNATAPQQTTLRSIQKIPPLSTSWRGSCMPILAAVLHRGPDYPWHLLASYGEAFSPQEKSWCCSDARLFA